MKYRLSMGRMLQRGTATVVIAVALWYSPFAAVADTAREACVLDDHEVALPVAADTFVASAPLWEDVNMGSRRGLWVGYDGQPEPGYRDAITLVRFDLASPTNIEVVSATLKMWLDAATIQIHMEGEALPIDLHTVDAGWTEHGTTWTSKPDLAALLSRSDVGVDASRWVTWTVQADVVQEWVDHSETNFGLALAATENPNDLLRVFVSRDHETGSLHPRLVVTYRSVTPTVTATLSPTASLSPSPTPSATSTSTPTLTQTATATPTGTTTGTATPTGTPVATSTPLPTAQPDTLRATLVADAYVASGPQWERRNLGESKGLFVGYDEEDDLRNTITYLRFDVPRLESAEVVDARLRMWLSYATFDGTVTSLPIVLNEVEASWEESGITWDNRPRQLVTLGPPVSVDIQVDRWVGWPVPAAVVQQWVDGSRPNHGLALTAQDNPRRFVRAFLSKESGAGEHAPELIVTYRVVTPTPTPTPTATHPYRGWRCP